MLEKRTLAQSLHLPRQWPYMFRALNHRNFRLFWFGQLISLIGSWMQSLALQWLVYQITGSAFAMGTVAAFTALPVLLLSPFTGVLVDRYSKRWVVFWAQMAAMISSLTLAMLTFSDSVVYWHVLALALVNGMVNAVDMPARQAFTSEMIGDRDDLMNAIGLNASIFNGARAIGPAVAAMLVSAVGLAWAFLLNGLSFIAVLIGLTMMTGLIAPAPRKSNSSSVNDFMDGARYALQTPLIRIILVLVLVPSILGFGYTSLLPIFADQILVTPLIPEGSARLGAMMVANGIGALLAALRVARTNAQTDRRKLLLNGALGFGVGICLLALNRSFWLALPIMTFTGFSMVSFLATANTILQTTAVDSLRGRVMGFYVMTLVGLGLVGSLQAGFVAEHWGTPIATGIGGFACVISALLGLRSKALLSLVPRREQA
ncbi:MFS transporter [Herpetosiphon giganteus]|uniref:MFS transporter n=1 Tax=Herpetosiphon giganteus TaxID=2029754 RepID=UPI00195D0185|nr:MFS transporter [Herpetosiphon giganteus]MBM7841509.1 MFS family permease [Herpetosiphon giganteus]